MNRSNEVKNLIYSKAFMIKSQTLDISKICPNEISCLKIEIENVNLPPELRTDLNHHNYANHSNHPNHANQNPNQTQKQKTF